MKTVLKLLVTMNTPEQQHAMGEYLPGIAATNRLWNQQPLEAAGAS